MSPEPQPAVTDATSGMPVLLEGVNVTLSTIERRTRYYRNLVIVISVTVSFVLILALFLHRRLPLAGVFLVPLYVRGFLLLDQRLVETWRRHLIQMADERRLNISQLQQTLLGLRHLPQQTVRSMLAMLDTSSTKTDIGPS